MDDIKKSLDSMILSASGWRKVFTIDGNEESVTSEISIADRVISAAMAKSFGDFLKKESGKANPVVVLSQDSRYTGTTIADIMIRVFISMGLKVQYLFISAAPETFAYTKMAEETDGFAYISASHNPIGHNGVKFGLKTGGVIDGSQVKPLIEDFKSLLTNENSVQELVSLANDADPSEIESILLSVDPLKSRALDKYRFFTDQIISGTENHTAQKEFLGNLSDKIKKSGFGIVAELNGSARTLTIDRKYLESLGVKIESVNDKPREISHRIVPEGRSLNQCCEILDKKYKEDPDFALGYVPDNDGDRGNLVYYNTDSGKAEIIEAQTVFAISVLAELSSIYYNNPVPGKVAVCVNGPTSMRIDAIAECFDAVTFRAEVGEANVVNLANIKRKEGYTVRILGEGSNGGNITHPAAVRDPLNTISAILKLLTLTSEPGRPGLFELWCIKSNQMDKYRENFTLTDIIKTIPPYVTTSAYEDKAILKINTMSHKVLKKNYEEIFLASWEDKKDILTEAYGITSWEVINLEGTEEKFGIGADKRSGEEKGGYKILFKDIKGNNSAYMWMRGSGTEPVFRVLVDSRGENPAKEKELLDWHTEMVKKADSLSIS